MTEKISDKLKDVFSLWEFHPLDPNAIFNRTRSAINEFRRGALASSLLDDLGMDFDFRDIFNDLNKTFSPESKARAKFSNHLFSEEKAKIFERFFQIKIKEQHLLKRAQKQFEFLATIGGRRSVNDIDTVLQAIKSRYDLNDEYLHLSRDEYLNQNSYMPHSLNLAMMGYLSSKSAQMNYTPLLPQNIIPFMAKTCRDLHQTAYEGRNLRCFHIHRNLSFNRSYVMRENIQNTERQDLADKLAEYLQDAQAELYETELIIDQMVTSAQTTFPEYSHKIKKPTPEI